MRIDHFSIEAARGLRSKLAALIKIRESGKMTKEEDLNHQV